MASDQEVGETAMRRETEGIRHLTPSIAVILFAVFSFAGWLYETIENVFTFGGIYLRASLMLPWCPIYGIGGLLIVAVLEPVRSYFAARAGGIREIAVVCIGIFVLAAVVELAGSFACEAVMGYVPWDYSHAFLNFQGRIAPAYTMRFVVLGLIALYLVYPITIDWAQRHELAAAKAAFVIVCLFVGDCVLQALGVWGFVKDLLVPLGINHW